MVNKKELIASKIRQVFKTRDKSNWGKKKFFLIFGDFEKFLLTKIALKNTASYICIIKFSMFPGSVASSSDIPSASRKSQRGIQVV